MTDSLLRSRRQADRSSDPLDLARVLVERMRSGSIDSERVALAAYCGSEAAREVLGPSWRSDLADRQEVAVGIAIHRTPDGSAPLSAWLQGLSRWQAHPYSAPVRAALAAAEAVYRAQYDVAPRALAGRGLGHAVPVRRALDAVAAWLADPSEERIRHACRTWFFTRDSDGAPLTWIPCASEHGGERATPGALTPNEWNSRATLECAELHPSGEPAIREAIQSAIIAWALGGKT